MRSALRHGFRALLTIVALAGVAIAAWSGYTIFQGADDSDELVLFVESATSSEPPTTVAPEPEVREIVAPVSIIIDQISLENEVRAVGIEDDGALEIPDETEVGWYQYGSAPGLPGATVLAAHVSWNDTIGPFHQLGNLVPGDEVDVALTDGSTRRYEVVERTMYAKDALPADRIWTAEGDETLVMITCGGSFNPEIRRYRHNIVVYAVPVEQTDPELPNGARASAAHSGVG